MGRQKLQTAQPVKSFEPVKTVEKTDTTSQARGKKNGISAAEFTKIHGNLSEDQKKLYEQMLELNSEVQTNELEAAYKFGEYVAEAESGEKKYGKKFIPTLAKLLGHTSGYLYERKTFYEKEIGRAHV